MYAEPCPFGIRKRTNDSFNFTSQYNHSLVVHSFPTHLCVTVRKKCDYLLAKAGRSIITQLQMGKCVG